MAAAIDPAAIKVILGEIAEETLALRRVGKVASYIPELAGVDPEGFAVSVAFLDGRTAEVGAVGETFSIQSISKVFNLTLALGKIGDVLWRRVGREPSGNAFNSIVQLEQEQGIPRNPFINAGAIVVSDVLLAGHEPKETIAETVTFLRFLAGDESIVVDKAVAQSEKATGNRNFALAYFLKAHGNLVETPDRVLGVYFHQCAIAMSCRQLARACLFLAADGRDPVGGRRIVSAQRARRINALMMTSGMYDASGDFAYRIGLPAKSGVGGGIVAVVPGVGTVAVWSPGLDATGNSLVGSLVLEKLVQRTGWTVFGGR
ncbi:glutaminase [Methylobrevis albus]|uniref:Glutaminase n=1 Tax=Methylobrevis albus TaxID=2793297 RepID=A0A931I0D7_9HYPH|nr:glutaminase [Methylobrevis albus]MBH0237029.1 glutaminase [Methylobrevis albus]